MTALISVVVPVFNNPHLFEALASLAAQDYPRVEAIIIDDGSREDATEEIRAYLAQTTLESFTVERFPENRGTVRAVNRGWELANGMILYTLAADDVFWNERVLSDWTRAFQESGADVMVGYRALYDEGLTRFLSLSPAPREARLIRPEDGRRLWKALSRENFIFGCTTARTAECVKRFGGVPECYRIIEDYPMNLRLCRLGAKIVLFDQVVIRYRAGGISTAAHVNAPYLRDTRTLFRQEVEPYVKWVLPVRIRAWWRIKGRLRAKRYQMLRARSGAPLWNVLCHMLYPENFYYRLRTLGETPARRREEARLAPEVFRPE